jgi:Ca2+/H+ antiporter, TMEM165/GDT1 family
VEALLPTFIALVLAETGGKVQRQTEALAMAFGARLTIIFALFLTSSVYLIVAGFAGIWVGELMNYQARTLMLGLALLFAASGVAWPKKSPASPPSGGALVTSLWRYAVAQFGDNSQFIVFAFAARGNAPLLATTAGVVGVLLASMPAFLYPTDWRKAVRLNSLRWVATGLLTLAGLISASAALRLI